MTDTPATTSMLDIPEALVTVTPSGVFVEWHARGMNIEMRVRETGVYALIEDARGNFERWSGSDSSATGRVLSALRAMEGRDA